MVLAKAGKMVQLPGPAKAAGKAAAPAKPKEAPWVSSGIVGPHTPLFMDESKFAEPKSGQCVCIPDPAGW